VDSATGSSPSPELAAALHRLRSTLARLKAELELAESDGAEARPGRLLDDLNEALMLLQEVEQAAFGVVPVLVVDDDARLAELTARGLRRLGYDADSTSALRQLRPKEIVVFDLGLAHALGQDARTMLKGCVRSW
jgi:FlaA1/EpsC-like NDP-sugar epimerase